MRLRSFILLLFFLPGIFLSSLPADPPESYISGRDVRLRTAPAIDAKVIGLMEIGTAVYVREKSTQKYTVGTHTDHWYKVFLSPSYILFENDTLRQREGVTGWVFGQFIQKDSIFKLSEYIQNTKWTAPAMPSALKEIQRHQWSNSAWDEAPEYGTWGIFFNGEKFMYESGNDPVPHYEIINVTETSPDTRKFEVRFLCGGYWEREIFLAPFPSKTISFSVKIFGRMDSLYFPDFPITNKLSIPELSESLKWLYNCSKPACFRVITDKAPMHISYSYNIVYDPYESYIDSLKGFADKGQLLFNTEFYGFHSSSKYTVNEKTDYWNLLMPYPHSFREEKIWIHGGDLEWKLTPEDVKSFLNSKCKIHPDEMLLIEGQPMDEFLLPKFYQETAAGKRHLVFYRGYFTITEPDGSLRMKIFNSDTIDRNAGNRLLVNFSNNLAYNITWDKSRGFLPYTDTQSNELLGWDTLKKVLVSSVLDDPLKGTYKNVGWVRE